MAEQLVPVSNVPFKPSADSAITAVYPTPGQDMPMPENRSMAEILWDSGEWDDFMAELSPADRNALAYNREFLCRPKQLIDPEEVATRIVAIGGRAFGKTFMGVQWIRMQIFELGCMRVAIVGETATEIKLTMIDGPSGFMALLPPEQRPLYYPQTRELKFPNGAHATLLYGDKPRQSRGGGVEAVWIDEIAKYLKPTELMQTLTPMVREPRADGKPTPVFMTTTPQPIPLIKNYDRREREGDTSVKIIRGTSHENLRNLAPNTIREMEQELGVGSRLWRQEVLGEILPEAEGALWKPEMILPYYAPLLFNDLDGPQRDAQGNPIVDKDALMAEMARAVVIVDPSGARDKECTNDEIGIMIIGKLRSNGHAVVIRDNSLVESPEQWGALIADNFHRYACDCVVGEINFGGDMVRATIHAQDRRIPFREVRASRGKSVRAEPVASLYHAKRVYHLRVPGMVGPQNLQQAEDQMFLFTPEGFMGEGSPDRADAIIWGLTFLYDLDKDKIKRAGGIARRRRT